MSKLAAIKANYVLETGTEYLPVKLTPDELDEFAHRAIALWQNAVTNEETEKERRKVWKKDWDETVREAKQATRIVDDGFELRPVKTKTFADMSKEEAVTYRQDTMEIVARRALTEDERERLAQGSLLEDDFE